MANIHFGIGTVGSGNAEVFGFMVQVGRNASGRLEFDYPTKVGEGHCFLWVGENDSVDGIVEAKYMQDNSLDYSENRTFELVKNAIAKHYDSSDIFIGGCGVTLYIERLMAEYPDATVYFTEREHDGADMDAIKYRSNMQGYENSDNFLTYMQDTNDRLAEATRRVLASVGRDWTTGNTYVISEGFKLESGPRRTPPKSNNATNDVEKMIHETVVFMSPTKVAVYVPTFSVNLF